MQDEVALVTGGLRGLGRAMTLGLAASGYRVAAVGHISNDIADIEDMADSLKLRELILPLAADLREPNDCDEVIGKTLARFGSVDILVNKAGLTFTYIDPPRFRRGTPQNFWQVSDQIVENVIATNFLAADRMARRVAPAMLEAGWGRIINVTTKLDTMNQLGTHPYGASKAALEMATEVWSSYIRSTNAAAVSLTASNRSFHLAKNVRRRLILHWRISRSSRSERFT
jgi:NAD(P)-dependent dehydrogenase (short-subunit alcohol dehydrogenase family)